MSRTNAQATPIPQRGAQRDKGAGQRPEGQRLQRREPGLGNTDIFDAMRNLGRLIGIQFGHRSLG